ncbi:hypothetical protein TD95_000699 [Thielaviopsis punctulata]|uniref:AN1-type domain-containing protein n=1 Tax=Thielaviopsis punctulata TaxID=72032 RepID=A0A0F4ZIG9_9PEZI|nr:hypothetical protein TD95_000699 [Thielaviopsis punctulata]
MAKKARCTFKQCREVAQRIVGDCGFCHGHFCGKHRLLEDHKCSGLEDVSISRSSSFVSSLSSAGAAGDSVPVHLHSLPTRAFATHGNKVLKGKAHHKCRQASIPRSATREPTATSSTKWWLVGLYDTLDSLNSDCGDLFTDSDDSAKNSLMSKTLPNSSRSAPLSSRVFNETDYDDY